MRRPTIIILACFGFILGIVFEYYFNINMSYLWLLFVASTFMSIFILNKKLAVIPIFLIMFVFGMFTIYSHINNIYKNGISGNTFKKTIAQGVVVGDPYWDKDRNYVFVVSNLVIDGKNRLESIKVKTFSSAVKEGNRVSVEGKIYPTLAKPGYTMSYSNVRVLDSSQPLLVRLKNNLYTGADIAIGGEASNFIKGILVGARTSLSKDIQATLNSTGLSHVVAVSGYNLTILVVILQRLLKKKWAWGGLVLSLLLVWGFVLLTGGSSSIMRAAIMASVFLVASYYGRDIGIFVCIAITAVITLLYAPSAVIDDIGWQLSFLSLTGIVVLSPAIQRLLPKKPKLLVEIVSITLAAQIATVPYLLYVFGSYSMVAFVANTVLMPLIPLLMLVGFTVSIMGLVAPNYAYILGRPIAGMINYIFDFLYYLQNKDSLRINYAPNITIIVSWYLLLVVIGFIVYSKGLSSPFQKHQELVK